MIRVASASRDRFSDTILLSCICALPWTPRAVAASEAVGQGLPAITTRQLDQLIDTIMTEERLPSVVVGIWMPGEGRYVVALGEADLASHSEQTLTQPISIMRRKRWRSLTMRSRMGCR